MCSELAVVTKAMTCGVPLAGNINSGSFILIQGVILQIVLNTLGISIMTVNFSLLCCVFVQSGFILSAGIVRLTLIFGKIGSGDAAGRNLGIRILCLQLINPIIDFLCKPLGLSAGLSISLGLLNKLFQCFYLSGIILI